MTSTAPSPPVMPCHSLPPSTDASILNASGSAFWSVPVAGSPALHCTWTDVSSVAGTLNATFGKSVQKREQHRPCRRFTISVNTTMCGPADTVATEVSSHIWMPISGTNHKYLPRRTVENSRASSGRTRRENGAARSGDSEAWFGPRILFGGQRLNASMSARERGSSGYRKRGT